MITITMTEAIAAEVFDALNHVAVTGDAKAFRDRLITILDTLEHELDRDGAAERRLIRRGLDKNEPDEGYCQSCANHGWEPTCEDCGRSKS